MTSSRPTDRPPATASADRGPDGEPASGEPSRAVLLAVDDDERALDRLRSELERRHAGDYRVECLPSAGDALAALEMGLHGLSRPLEAPEAASAGAYGR